MRLRTLRAHLLSSCALAHNVARRGGISLVHPTCSLATSRGSVQTDVSVGCIDPARRWARRGGFPRMRAATSLATSDWDAPVDVDVGYCTDVEGDLGFWQRYCERSSVLVRGADGHLDLAHDSCHFVFGGDSVDKGGRDLAFLRDLLSLKERHPRRVHLVLGNRDINKMRLAAELAPDNWLPAAQHPGVYWRRDGGATSTPAGFLAAEGFAAAAAATGTDLSAAAPAAAPPAPAVGGTCAGGGASTAVTADMSGQGGKSILGASTRVVDDRPSRLRFMLRETMGAPLAFEGRRNELELEAGTQIPEGREGVSGGGSSAGGDDGHGGAILSEIQSGPLSHTSNGTAGVGSGYGRARVSDEAVLDSFEFSILSPEGLLRRYLQASQLAVKIGSMLFVHGAVDIHNAGFVPGLGRRCGDVDEWVTKLNQFAADQVTDFCSAVDAGSRGAWAPETTRWSADFFTRPGGGLMSYGMARQPSGERTPTIVYASFLDDGQPAPPHPDVLAFLSAGGVRTLACGHQPHGDAPVVMRSTAPDGSEVIVVTADTSFSAQVEWQHTDALFLATEDPPPQAGAGASPPPSPSSLVDPFDPFAKPRGPAPKASPQTRGNAVADVLFREIASPPSGGAAAARPAGGGRAQRMPPGRAGAPGVAGGGCAAGPGDDGAGVTETALATDRGGCPGDTGGGLTGAAGAGPTPVAAGSGTVAAVRVRARLSNGKEMEFDTAREPEVGRLREDGWWVKGTLPGGQLLLSRGKGYRVENIIVQREGEDSPAQEGMD